MPNPKKIAIVSVINDLVTDQRVNRTCLLLQECGYEVLLIGRTKRDSQPLAPRSYRCKRMRMFFESGPAFYAWFNLRLFFLLLFRQADLLVANDLDTLWPNYTVARWKGIRLIYDSHEIFCEVPELQANPSKKRIWERLERSIVPKLDTCLTVNESIAAYFKERYGRPFAVLRNIPNTIVLPELKTRTDLNLPDQKKIIILQGAGINVQRGAEELVQAMAFLPDHYLLLIVGSGDVIGQLKQDATAPQIAGKVMFVPKQNAAGLKQYTMNADLGVTIDKDTNLNYHFSLPNKIFDYIHAGIPVLASRLPEIEKLVEHYRIGVFIDSHEPSHIAAVIRSVLESPGYAQMKQNTRLAAAENNWDKEKQVLKALLGPEA
ncbi:MAG: glycosyltransferase [Bacteroidetes bacterium]|nr:glycosyltransferase [Bacteroidota bacterium]